MAVKKKLLASQSCKCIHMQLEANNAEGSPEPTDLKTRVQQARSELAPGAPLPPDINLQLFQDRWNTDREIGWQQEWARRQEACQTAATAVEVCTWILLLSFDTCISTASAVCGSQLQSVQAMFTRRWRCPFVRVHSVYSISHTYVAKESKRQVILKKIFTSPT